MKKQKIKIYTVDAFTNQVFKGNPAGVVIDTDDLSDKSMQEIAAEINMTETAFIKKSNNDGANFHIRYFTSEGEIPFCGHATLSAAWILATKYDYIKKTNHLIFDSKVGLIPIDWKIKSGKLQSIFMTQIKPKIKEVTDELDIILEMLCLSKNDIDDRFLIKYGYTGLWSLLIPVKSMDIVDRISPNLELLKKHNLNNDITSTLIFTVNTKNYDFFVYSRDFAPAVGIVEDLVTGSSNGALTGYLILEGHIKRGKNEFKIIQTNSMNRIGELNIKTSTDRNNQVKIQVGGKAVMVVEGYINI